MKNKDVIYICSSCGYESLKWLGKCTQCGDWNTFSEELREKQKRKSAGRTQSANHTKAVLFDQIEYKRSERKLSGIGEFDRTLGGGFVAGSIVLLAGDPGIGKSTLLLQAAVKSDLNVVYVSGEESLQQIKMRADRLKITSKSVHILSETEIGTIIEECRRIKPDLVIIDSIQTMYDSSLQNTPGTITQIRESAIRLQQYAKQEEVCILIIGHITKEGFIAGPKALEHLVDTVLQFESDNNNGYRILRTVKNRFGSTNELGVFIMSETGMIGVENPSELFLSQSEIQNSGSAVTASIEGTRPLLLEVQALVVPTHYGNPQRVANGFDPRRLAILLAVIEKKAEFRLSSANVFVSFAGGVRIDEPAVDLSVCMAIISSLTEKNVQRDDVLIGEVGLAGEIRGVNMIEKRLHESAKLGFTRAIIPYKNLQNDKPNVNDLEIIGVKDLKETINLLGFN